MRTATKKKIKMPYIHSVYGCSETRHLYGRHRGLVIPKLHPCFTLHASCNPSLTVTIPTYTTRFKRGKT